MDIFKQKDPFLKALEDKGLSSYSKRILRDMQKKSADYNDAIKGVSEREGNRYNVISPTYYNVYSLAEDLNQDVNYITKKLVRMYKKELNSIIVDGHTLGFKQHLEDLAKVLKGYTYDMLKDLSYHERISLLKQRYLEVFGYAPSHSDEDKLIEEIREAEQTTS